MKKAAKYYAVSKDVLREDARNECRSLPKKIKI